jgi:hypothetical protein
VALEAGARLRHGAHAVEERAMKHCLSICRTTSNSARTVRKQFLNSAPTVPRFCVVLLHGAREGAGARARERDGVREGWRELALILGRFEVKCPQPFPM